MTKKYGPAERIDEQIDICLHDPTGTDIVVLSMLGEPAVPKLCRLLDGDTNAGDSYKAPGRLEYGRATVIIRALGMIASPNAVPTLARRLSAKKERSADDADTRALANALRKIGDEESLRTLVANLQILNLPHARLVLDDFGERATEALLAKAAKPDDRSSTPAARLLTARRAKEAIPLLTHAAERGRTEAFQLLAYYGPDAPKDWATKRLVALLPDVMSAYLRASQRQTHYYGGTPTQDESAVAQHDALLRILYNAGDARVVSELLPYFAIERPAGLTSGHREPRASVSLLALTFGKASLPHLEDARLASLSNEAKLGAQEVRRRIENGEEPKATELKLREGPLGEDKWTPQPEYIPSRPQPSYDDE